MNAMEVGLNRYLSNSELEIIGTKRVGIAGCGGLGSNTAQNLVRLGFKKFLLVDFDIIENTNLNRQFFFYDQLGLVKCEALKCNLLRINPDLDITAIRLKITKENIKEIFNNCDIIVEGFDKVQFKTLLIEELSPIKQCVTATGLGNYWNVDGIVTKKINKNLTIVGDFTSDVDSGISPLSPGVTIGAAKEAAAVLEFTLGGSVDKSNR